MKKIKNIIFDYGNVIVDIEPLYAQQSFRKLLDGEYDSAFEKIQKSGFFYEFEKGLISKEVFINALQGASIRQISKEKIIDAWNSMLIGIPGHRLDFLRKVAKNYRIFLLSNTNTIHIEWLTKYLKREHQVTNFENGFFEKVYYSFLINLRKPDKEAFEFVLADTGIIPEETLFVDDKIENINTAMEMNLQVFHHNPEQDISKELIRILDLR